MRKIILFYLISLFLNYLINCKKLIPVQAEFDPVSNSLIYEGKIYTISDMDISIYEKKEQIEIKIHLFSMKM